MQDAYPHWEFWLKDGDASRGHAASMNLVIEVKTPMVLYLEDDWELLVSASEFSKLLRPRRDSLQGRERVAQVLLDSVEDGQEKRNLASGTCCMSLALLMVFLHRFHNDGGMARFLFESWPVGARNQEHAPTLRFDTQEALFEQHFSLDFYRRGLRVACLNATATKHMGKFQSAYALNGAAKRYWD